MRQALALVAKGIITAALLYFAIGRTNFSMIGERLGSLDVPWMLAAVALAGVQIVLGGAVIGFSPVLVTP